MNDKIMPYVNSGSLVSAVRLTDEIVKSFADGTTRLGIASAHKGLRRDTISITNGYNRPEDNTVAPDAEGYMSLLPKVFSKNAKEHANSAGVIMQSVENGKPVYVYRARYMGDGLNFDGLTHIVMIAEIERLTRLTGTIYGSGVTQAKDKFFVAYPLSAEHPVFLFDSKTPVNGQPQVIEDSALLKLLFQSVENFREYAGENIARYLRRASKRSQLLNHRQAAYVNRGVFIAHWQGTMIISKSPGMPA